VEELLKYYDLEIPSHGNKVILKVSFKRQDDLRRSGYPVARLDRWRRLIVVVANDNTLCTLYSERRK
jgi:hypothetical protein